MRDCGRVNMVQVDNTTEECDGKYMDYKCIVVSDSFSYFKTKKNITFLELFNSIEDLIKEQEKSIIYLKRELEILKGNM